MGIHHSEEHLTPLAGDSYPPATMNRGDLPDAPVKGLSMIITNVTKKYQKLYYLPAGNNNGRYFLRVWYQGPTSNDLLGGRGCITKKLKFSW